LSFTEKTEKRRIAAGLLLGHIVANGRQHSKEHRVYLPLLALARPSLAHEDWIPGSEHGLGSRARYCSGGRMTVLARVADCMEEARCRVGKSSFEYVESGTRNQTVDRVQVDQLRFLSFSLSEAGRLYARRFEAHPHTSDGKKARPQLCGPSQICQLKHAAIEQLFYLVSTKPTKLTVAPSE
jgi:hypothetical protein